MQTLHNRQVRSKMDLFLVNYRHCDSEPLKSIMQLPKEEAFKMAEKLYAQSQCRAHRRFGPDFSSYYAHRLKTEKWLYDCFIKLGGRPQTKHPFYFVLQHCENFYQNFDEGAEIKININDIDRADVSFTFGDSMAQMGKDSMKPMFLKDSLYELIRGQGNDVKKFLNSIKEPYVCMEAQLWTNRYFTDTRAVPC